MSVINRESFDQRIGNDLCEVIVSYLTLKDRLRLECVSKQFKDCVFKRKNQIIINNEFAAYVKQLDGIFKKCKSFKYIKIVVDIRLKYFLNIIIEILIAYCTSIYKIDCNFYYINFELFKRFIRKFGKSLAIIKGYSIDDFRSYDRVFIDYINQLSIGKPYPYNQNHTNISEIINRFNERTVFGVKMKSNTINNSKLSIHFTINLEDHKCISLHSNIDDFDGSQLSNIFVQLSRLEKLKSLDMSEFISKSSKPYEVKYFIDWMTILADNCLNLMSIKIDLRFNEINSDLFKVFSRFKHLSRLSVKINYKSNELNIFNDLLSDLKQLTHFAIVIENCCYKTLIQLFDSLANYSPNLVYFDISSDFVPENNRYLRNQFLRAFVNKSKLQTILIEAKPYRKISDELIRQIVLNCNKINRISITGMSEEIVDSIINSVIISRQNKNQI